MDNYDKLKYISNNVFQINSVQLSHKCCDLCDKNKDKDKFEYLCNDKIKYLYEQSQQEEVKKIPIVIENIKKNIKDTVIMPFVSREELNKYSKNLSINDYK